MQQNLPPQHTIIDTASHWTSYTIETLVGIVITLLGWAGFRVYRRMDEAEKRINALEVAMADVKVIDQEIKDLANKVDSGFKSTDLLIQTLIQKLPD